MSKDPVRARPILYRAEMVRARHDGSKTQTRRPINRLLRFGNITEFGRSDTRGYDWHFRDKRMLWNDLRHDELLKYCPYGQPGDLLYCREAWQTLQKRDDFAPCEMAEDVDKIRYLAGPERNPLWAWGKNRPGIHLPRWASRSTDRITNVKIERVREITEADALAEGFQPGLLGNALNEVPIGDGWTVSSPGTYASAVGKFDIYWDELNAARGFGIEANPWTWAISFETIHANVDEVLAEEAA